MSLSTAAVIGVAIGSAAAGALIMGAVWLFSTYKLVMPEDEDDPEKRAARAHKSFQERRRAFSDALDAWVTNYGPDHRSLEARRDDIHSCVRSYVAYQLDPNAQDVQLDDSTFAALGVPAGEWKRLLEPGADRVHILSTFICRFLMSRMAPDSDPATTLLPPDLAATYARILAMPTDNGKGFEIGINKMIWQNDEFPVMMRNYWRSMTCYMSSAVLPVNNCVGIPCFDANNPCTANAKAAIDVIRQAMAPFDVRPDPEHRQPAEGSSIRLERVMLYATDLALRVFSSPRPFEFFWPDEAPERPPPADYDAWIIFPDTAAQERGDYHAYELSKTMPERPYYNVRCFGIRGLNRVPGTQMDHLGQTLLPTVVADPMDDDYVRMSDRRNDVLAKGRREDMASLRRAYEDFRRNQ